MIYSFIILLMSYVDFIEYGFWSSSFLLLIFQFRALKLWYHLFLNEDIHKCIYHNSVLI